MNHCQAPGTKYVGKGKEAKLLKCWKPAKLFMADKDYGDYFCERHIKIIKLSLYKHEGKWAYIA